MIKELSFVVEKKQKGLVPFCRELVLFERVSSKKSP
jgi:hypothetical protein